MAKVQIRAELLETQLTEFLRRLELAPGMVRLVETALLDIWNDLRNAAIQEQAAIRRLADLGAPQEAFRRGLGRRASLEDPDLEAALGFASHILTRTSTLWEAASPDQKRRFQRLIFPEGLTFDGEALGTPATALLFRVLGRIRPTM